MRGVHIAKPSFKDRPCTATYFRSVPLPFYPLVGVNKNTRSYRGAVTLAAAMTWRAVSSERVRQRRGLRPEGQADPRT